MAATTVFHTKCNKVTCSTVFAMVISPNALDSHFHRSLECTVS